jgi:signal transduction histidine kinase
MCEFIAIPQLLFYTHVPAFVISFLLGLFIFSSNRKSSVNKNLFFFILFLCFWIFSDLAPWLSSDPNVNLFFVRIIILVVLSLVFFLFFTESLIGKEISLRKKLLYFIPFVPILVFLFTNYNAYILDSVKCSSQYGILIWYVYLLSAVYTFLSAKNLLSHYRQKNTNEKIKNQIKLILLALLFIVAWFIIISLLAIIFSNEEIYMLTPLGIVIFIAALAYSITKYQFLNIKLIAAQTLTYSIWILIGSQYFFADSIIVYLLVSLTLALSMLFGYMLIKSVKLEVERKEQLQKMSDSLAQANDQLRKLDNAKTEFISIASHQLRTPVTAIKGFASLLMEGSYGEVSKEVQGAVEKIYISSERLVNLIEDLLNVSRIESGRLTFTFENASVEKILKELHDNFILIAKSKKFYLDLKMPKEPLPEFKMDASKIRELISNFIDNALKYTEKGGVTISAEMKDAGAVIDDKGFVKEGEKSPYGKVVRITVSDTGIGIPKEEIPYLFRKFSRGKDVSRLHVGGTGLGLYVGKAIADAHHGATWVESDGAGMGSRFIIEIPVNNS